MISKEKIEAKNPDGKRWKKITAIFDTDSVQGFVSRKLLDELGVGHDVLTETVTLHVKVLGDEYSWKFRVNDGSRQKNYTDLVIGEEFMRLQGVLVKETSKGKRIEYAPGYPQSPVI